ncbi:uncharacterized protein LOC143449370 isoform X1 [Clavelina lepadiformis]|uniref:uncharacterized protein LOC143449370 isoform X1 n=2 Tax=Clavelina lepadiformis TaxID=159417 RepID=UPI004042C316
MALNKDKESCCRNQNNFKYLKLKLLFLFRMIGGVCGYAIYQAIFLKHVGLSSYEAGLIFSVEKIIAAAASLCLGMISDKTKRPKEILIIALLSGSAILSAQFFVLPPKPHKELADALMCYNRSQSFCNDTDMENLMDYYIDRNQDNVQRLNKSKNCLNISWNLTDFSDWKIGNSENVSSSADSQKNLPNLPSCLCNSCQQNYTNLSLADCFRKVADAKNTGSIYKEFPAMTNYGIVLSNNNKTCYVIFGLTKTEKITINSFGFTFWIMLVLVSLLVFSVSGTSPIIDATIINALGEEDRWRYGRQIILGCALSGAMAAFVGHLKDYTQESIGALRHATTNISYIPMYATNITSWICASCVAYKLDIKYDGSNRVKLAKIKVVLRNPFFVIFLVLLLFYGFAQAILEYYVFWFAEMKLNASTMVLGLSTLAGGLSDIPVLFYSGYVIKRVGCPAIFCVTMLLFSIRFYLYSLLTEAWMIIPMDLFRAITYGLMWPAVCNYAGSISPPELRATTMALVYMFSWNLGAAIGSFAGGYLLDLYGGEGLFKISSLICLAGLLFYVIAYFLVAKFIGSTKDHLHHENKENGNCDVDVDKFEMKSMIEQKDGNIETGMN